MKNFLSVLITLILSLGSQNSSRGEPPINSFVSFTNDFRKDEVKACEIIALPGLEIKNDIFTNMIDRNKNHLLFQNRLYLIDHEEMLIQLVDIKRPDGKRIPIVAAIQRNKAVQFVAYYSVENNSLEKPSYRIGYVTIKNGQKRVIVMYDANLIDQSKETAEYLLQIRRAWFSDEKLTGPN